MNSLNNKQLVLGLVGNAASGKDFVASFFEDKGYVHFSTSELVRQEISRRKLKPSRALQTAVADEIRNKKGPAYFVEESLKIVNNKKRPEKVLLSGLYAVSEGKYITQILGGHLVSVVAQIDQPSDIQLRYSRLSRRADGSRDSLTMEEFEAAYLRENSGACDAETNVGGLLDLARFTIVNAEDTTADALDIQVRLILESVE